jgi:aquaporin Z
MVISFIFMTMVLNVTNTQGLARYTGLFVGAIVATYIVVESPFSGISMNPARSFGSALPGQVWTALWVYFTAPLIGMLAAAELYVRRNGVRRVICAKLHHQGSQRCIFHCGYRVSQLADERSRHENNPEQPHFDTP